ncbi:glycosyltransferase family 2 protein [Candidatus Pelagibacter sp.]|nr:glycosyltransferase family 2 protein [Candidatus Pelagibacter sp.]
MISIIVPYYKSEKYINKCINSVFNQSNKNYELIIVDDEHSENAKKILNKIKKKNKKVNIFKTHIPQSGVSIARNIGIKKSKGKFIAFLDSDDFWKKQKLEKQIKFMKKFNLDLSYTFYKDFNSKGIIRNIESNNYSYNNLIKKCNIGTSSVILKKNLNIKFKNLNTKEDYCLWLELFKKNIRVGCVKQYLMFHRIRKGSLSSNEFDKIISAFKIYNMYNKFNFILSIYFVFRLYKNAFIKKYF